MSKPLAGKVAIITGAGGGIGRPTALLLAHSGARLVVSDINEAAAQETAARITAAGGDVVAMRTNITDEKDVQAMVASALEHFGQLDVLVNNAAVGSPKDHDIVSMDADAWDHVVLGNSRGTMLCCKHALPALMNRNNGTIVNIASGAALVGQLTQAAYNASKAAVISLTQSVATMYGKRGIRCNAIAPGLILHERLAAAMPPVYAQIDKDNVLTPWQGCPDDIAQAVLFLASDASRFITGHVLPVDGGLLMHSPYYSAIRALEENPHWQVEGVLGVDRK